MGLDGTVGSIGGLLVKILIWLENKAKLAKIWALPNTIWSYMLC